MHTEVFPNGHAATGVLPAEVCIIEPYITMKLYAGVVFVHGKMQCFSLKEPIWLHLRGFVVGG